MAIPASPPLRVFGALANPVRWQILSLLATQTQSASALARQLPVSRPAAVKHLAVLEDAGLVVREQAGREVRFATHSQPLADAAEWMAVIATTWERRLAKLKEVAEERRQPDPRSGPGAGSAT